MNTQLVPVKPATNTLSVIPVVHDGVYMSDAIDTARLAAKYASQLSHEYHNILHRQLKKAAPDLADKFKSLFTELTTMTDRTFDNVRGNQK